MDQAYKMNTRCQFDDQVLFFSDFHWAFLWVLAAVIVDNDSVRVPHKGTDKPKKTTHQNNAPSISIKIWKYMYCIDLTAKAKVRPLLG